VKGVRVVSAAMEVKVNCNFERGPEEGVAVHRTSPSTKTVARKKEAQR